MSTAQLERHWTILKRIPPWGSPITVDTLAKYLVSMSDVGADDKEFRSFCRTVQRDINQLEAVTQYLHVDRSGAAHKVCWARNAPPLKISALSDEEVLAFGVLQKLDTDLLPRTLHDILEPFFKAAQLQAGQRDGVKRSVANRWLQKIARLPEGPGFIAPSVNGDVELAVHEALLEESRLEIVYRSGQAKVVHPQAIVQQGVRTYLLATQEGSKEVRTYLLHRIDSAKKTLGRYESAKEFDLGQHLRKGISSPVFPIERYGSEVVLSLWVHRSTSWLGETRLGEDQTFEASGDDFHLRATVSVTEELIRWILSMGRHVKVLGPDFIRERIKSDLNAAAQIYTQ